jgi:branched-chain amino acid transport system permease protein
LLLTIEHFVTIYTEHNNLVLGIIILIAVLGFRRGIGDFLYEFWLRRRETRAAKVPTETRARTGPAREDVVGEGRKHDARA